MSNQTIACPYCAKEIPLTETLSHQIKEELRKEFELKAKERELEIARREKSLAEEMKTLEDARKTIDQQVFQKLQAEKEKLKRESRKEVEDAIRVELKDLKDQNVEKERKLVEAQRVELEFRKKVRELEELRKNQELEITRKLDEERKIISEKARKEAEEEMRLKLLEKEKQLEDTKKALDEAKRKAQQGSMQTQGEVLELDLESLLKAQFPTDTIEPVPKGIRGADILQKVHNKSGHYCGAMIWESKHTKAWSDGWLSKLKDDQREVKAEIAVLVTETMPKGIEGFAQIEGVWVADYALSIALASVLRTSLMELAQHKLSLVGKSEKMEVLYNYLSGPEFRQKIEAIVESFKSMKEDLDQEKRAIIKIWAKREKQIEKIVNNTAGMYGDMQGIIGATLPHIKSLELTDGTEPPETDDT
ncbi:hypothetical protein BIY37_00505 [Candidatus Brocadia sapporoensis]|uniref:Caldesmon n=1 Tax=Candidatus Brocadia sapporoensis TaxID=392547 RepID=A0A1V6M3C4_9BACT|nr:DUF2130 domain-containing protein [Candidatus Brocadia sapporoensis]MDG6004343.1 DUF2130 domain-containing protein [Candidatus Brocadia sp.]OQD46924.1 hypothetical protein BIY37_00505 [Candidatus Brocadia sapporoensis]GJQ23263.1 MAG: hypothetical protein HBSAPP01_10530 [Candidatus Brocadia sapporoensis]